MDKNFSNMHSLTFLERLGEQEEERFALALGLREDLILSLS